MNISLTPECGRALMQEYLAGTYSLDVKAQHSHDVAQFAQAISRRILLHHPRLDLDSERVGFFAYVHDIGYAVANENHELHTIALLVERGLPPSVARKAMHGQFPEEFPECNKPLYYPVGLEGIILTYADMSVRLGKPISITDRIEDIKSRTEQFDAYNHEKKQSIMRGLDKAYPRLQRYESIVLRLAHAHSYKEFDT